MKRFRQKDKGFASILFTIGIMLLISIAVFSLLFLSVFEHCSVLNYSRYQQAYYLALGAQEEALCLLSSQWNSVDLTSWESLGAGEYRFEIVDLSPSRKKILSQGRVSSITRTFEAIVQIPTQNVNFSHLVNYSLYVDGNLEAEDLNQIIQGESLHPGILGINGDFRVHTFTGGSYPIDVKGNVFVENGNRKEFLKRFPQCDSNFSVYECNVEGSYFSWLMETYPDKVHVIDLLESEDYILDESSNITEMSSWDVLIVTGGRKLLIENLNFDGLLILHNGREIQIDNRCNISGMIMVFGKNTEKLNISGNIQGNIGMLHLNRTAYFSGQLIYQREVLENLLPYLSCNSYKNSSKYKLIMIKWSELQ